MQCVRPNFSAGRAASRSRISNRSRLLPGVDGRSAAARRFRDICRNYELEAGGDVSEDLRNLELSLRCGRQMQEPISIGQRGEHQPIVDRKLFDAVQEVQAKQRNNHVAVIEKSEALLIGLIYDDRGHRMTPVVAKKNGKQYRYYISRRYASNRASSHEVASNIEVRRNGIKVTARMTGVRFQKASAHICCDARTRPAYNRTSTSALVANCCCAGDAAEPAFYA